MHSAYADLSHHHIGSRITEHLALSFIESVIRFGSTIFFPVPVREKRAGTENYGDSDSKKAGADSFHATISMVGSKDARLNGKSFRKTRLAFLTRYDRSREATP